MKEYIIQLPNEKARTYWFVTMVILLVNAIVFSEVLVNATGEKIKNISAGGAMLSSVSLLFFLIYYYIKKLTFSRIGVSFILLAIFWILLGKYLLAAFILFFAVIGFYTSGKFKVIISADKILYPSFPVKTFLWNEVSNVMLKDSVLTIDLKNNKLIQAVIKEGSDETDEDEFNEFCRQQMKA